MVFDFFIIINKEIITLNACAKIVASAAPKAPKLKTATKIKSPIIFTTQAMATVISGVFESPIPRKIAPSKL